MADNDDKKTPKEPPPPPPISEDHEDFFKTSEDPRKILRQLKEAQEEREDQANE